MNRRLARCALALPLISFACSVDSRDPDVAEEVTRSIAFGVQATPQVTPLPGGSASGPQVVDLPQDSVGPTVLHPGGNVIFPVAWRGGNIVSVNLSFTQNNYFSIPVPLAGDQDSGVVQIPASLGAEVCDALDAVCHELSCFQQVVSADGSQSLARAIALVLDCGGTGCGEVGTGTVQPGDPCDETAECVPGSVCFNKYCVGAGVLRISLAFSVDSDFDLHVVTPSGSEIYFASRSADGGELDVDQCVSTCGTEPHVENVVFAANAPPGPYEVWVENYDDRASGDFTIEIAGDVTQTYTGSLAATRSASEHFTFTL